MNKNIIFQYLIISDSLKTRGPIKEDGKIYDREKIYREMTDISRQSFELYAEEIGCEYLFDDKPVFTKGKLEDLSWQPLFECLRVIYDPYFDQFDKVLFVDTDIVVNTKENIFDVSDAEVYGVLESDIRGDQDGGYNVWDYNKETYQEYVEKYEMHDCPLVPSFGIGHSCDSKITILNTGVVVWTKEARLKARELFDDWQKWCCPDRFEKGAKRHHMAICNDQPFISSQLMKYDFDLESICQSWNDTPEHYDDPQKWIDGKGERPCRFLHYTGGGHKITMVDLYKKNKFPIFNDDW